jgi:acyl-coenzyme A thioesterase PaaI-like protein
MAQLPPPQPPEPPAGPATADAATRSLGELLAATVPMVRSLNLQFLHVTPDHALLRLPDEPAYRNHVGGPHAGAMFTLAESASGAIVLAAFAGELSRAVPLPVHAEIDFRKIARGPLTASATLGRPAPAVIAELDAGRRPEFPVTVTLQREDGAVTGEARVVWTLRPQQA